MTDENVAEMGTVMASLPTVSCLMTFSNPKRDTADLRATLAALQSQTHPLHELFFADNAPDEDKAEIAALVAQYGGHYRRFPFRQWAIADSGQYNQMFAESTGEVIMILCPHWVLPPHWVEEMVRWLVELGPGNMVSTDADRRATPRYEGGPPVDWFADMPVRFQAPSYDLIDNVKVLLHRQDWHPFCTEFDPVEDDFSGLQGNNHALVFWGWEQTQRYGRRLWLRRDLEMWHAKDTHTPWVLEHSLERHDWSMQIYHRKLAGG